MLAGRDPNGCDLPPNPGVPEHVVGARRFLDPPRVVSGEGAHRLDRLVDTPHLVRVHHQDAVRPELSADQGGAAVVRDKVATHLHLHVGEARRYGFADECPDLDVVVAEPAGGRRVGGVARGDDRLLASCGFAPRVAEQIECFPGSQRVGDVAEVDACDKILRREIDEQLPQRLALDLGPEVPDRVDDRSGAEVDDTLLRTEPAQLAVRDEAPPEATHVGDDRLETPADHERLERANRRDAHLRPATTRERQPVTFDSVVRIGAQNQLGRPIVRIGVHRIRPVERPRGRNRTSRASRLTIRGSPFTGEYTRCLLAVGANGANHGAILGTKIGSLQVSLAIARALISLADAPRGRYQIARPV